MINMVGSLLENERFLKKPLNISIMTIVIADSRRPQYIALMQ
ncbi:hypothetical protein R3X28_02145 [Maribacter sp. TH_r10]|nr:hypothetical protein [Maribacter sp. TH_r10]MDV7137653.1 hypothetical protein [Maribacter sp. TH_r10]